MSEPSPNGPAISLEYSQRPPLPWVSRHRFKLILLALVIAIAIPIYRNWQPLKTRILWLYWSRQAAAFEMPRTSIPLRVFGRDEATAVIDSNPAYHWVNLDFDLIGLRPPGPAAAFSPKAYRELLSRDARLKSLLSGSGPYETSPIAFMSTLRRPDGVRRLVIVCGSSGTTFDLLEKVSTLVLPLPRLLDPIPSSPSLMLGKPNRLGRPLPTELQSGRIDPSDASHIIIPYVVDLTRAMPEQLTAVGDGKGEIDLLLQNDDSLVVKHRGPGVIAKPRLHPVYKGEMLP